MSRRNKGSKRKRTSSKSFNYVSEKKDGMKVLDIVNDLKSGMSKTEAAEKYNVSMYTIRKLYTKFDVEKTKTDVVEGEFTEVVEKEEKMTATKKKEGLSQEKIDTIIRMTNKGSSAREVAEAISVSTATVYYYRKKYEVTNPNSNRERQKQVNAVKKHQEEKSCEDIMMVPKEECDDILVEDVKENNAVASISSSELVVPNGTTYEFGNRINIEVGMITERHDMPVDQFIFSERITSKTMFDYEYLDKVVNDYLNENITFYSDPVTGIYYGLETLNVYVTGLQVALASVIKMCGLRGVNLNLLHYNLSKDAYDLQPVWNNFGYDALKTKFHQANRLTFVGCNSVDFPEGAEYFAVKCIDFTKGPNGQQRRTCDEYVSLDRNELWPIFSELGMKILNEEKTEKAIYLQKNKIEKGQEKMKMMISKTSNFKFYSY